MMRSINHGFARLQFDTRKRRSFYRELAALMRSGYSRNESVEFMWRIHSHEGTRIGEPMAIILADIRAGVRNGLEFGRTLRKWIPRGDYMVVGAIEGSDRLAEHLEGLAVSIGKQAGLRKTLFEALAYPVFLAFLAYGLLVYFNLQIAPSLEGLLPREQWTGFAGFLGDVGMAATDYAIGVAIAAVAFPLMLAVVLPRWKKRGRNLADRLPIFAMYRQQTGVYFLKSMAALMSVGMSAIEAIDRMRPSASSYVGHRLDIIRFHLLNGHDLGSAMRAAGTGWPDPDLNLTLGIFAHAPNFPVQLSTISDDWLQSTMERAEQRAGLFRLLAFLAVFGVISGMALAMYDIQSQITSGFH